MLNYNQPCVGSDDIQAVVDVLNTTMLTQGEKVPQFENDLMAYCNVQHAVAVSSGTAALHLACLALGVTQNDVVWTVSNSFVASANCARYCGADVEFVDIDVQTGQLSLTALEKKLKNTEGDKRPKVLIVVDYSGDSADLIGIRSLSKQYGFYIIQDASHSLGGEYHNNKTGCCDYSDITTFSFHPIKTITTAEGGALLTNNDKLAESARLLRTHGIHRDTSQHRWGYSQDILGMNYRMSDVQAALGISQLKKIDSFVSRRREIVERYQSMLTDELRVIGSEQSSCHLAPLIIESSDLNLLNKIFDFFSSNNIRLQKHYIPIHSQPYYRQLTSGKDLNETSLFYEKQISLPVFVGLENSQIDHVSKLMLQCLKEVRYEA